MKSGYCPIFVDRYQDEYWIFIFPSDEMIKETPMKAAKKAKKILNLMGFSGLWHKAYWLLKVPDELPEKMWQMKYLNPEWGADALILKKIKIEEKINLDKIIENL